MEGAQILRELRGGQKTWPKGERIQKTSWKISKPQRTCEANRNQLGELVRIRLSSAAKRTLKSHSVAFLAFSFNSLYPLIPVLLWVSFLFLIMTLDLEVSFHKLWPLLAFNSILVLPSGSAYWQAALFSSAMLPLFRNVCLLNPWLCIEPSEIYSNDLQGEGIMNKTVTKYSHKCMDSYP